MTDPNPFDPTEARALAKAWLNMGDALYAATADLDAVWSRVLTASWTGPAAQWADEAWHVVTPLMAKGNEKYSASEPASKVSAARVCWTIGEMIDNFVDDVAQIEQKELAEQLAEALGLFLGVIFGALTMGLEALIGVALESLVTALSSIVGDTIATFAAAAAFVGIDFGLNVGADLGAQYFGDLAAGLDFHPNLEQSLIMGGVGAVIGLGMGSLVGKGVPKPSSADGDAGDGEPGGINVTPPITISHDSAPAAGGAQGFDTVGFGGTRAWATGGGGIDHEPGQRGASEAPATPATAAPDRPEAATEPLPSGARPDEPMPIPPAQAAHGVAEVPHPVPGTHIRPYPPGSRGKGLQTYNDQDLAERQQYLQQFDPASGAYGFHRPHALTAETDTAPWHDVEQVFSLSGHSDEAVVRSPDGGPATTLIGSDGRPVVDGNGDPRPVMGMHGDGRPGFSRPGAVADAMLSDPGFRTWLDETAHSGSRAVVLTSCEGSKFAQELADKLNVRVFAADSESSLVTIGHLPSDHPLHGTVMPVLQPRFEPGVGWLRGYFHEYRPQADPDGPGTAPGVGAASRPASPSSADTDLYGASVAGDVPSHTGRPDTSPNDQH